jgi:hypothetical protein
MEDSIDTMSLVRQLWQKTPSWTGQTLEESERVAEVGKSIERLQLRDQIYRVTFPTSVEDDPSRYGSFLRSAGVGALVNIHYPQHGYEVRGIVQRVDCEASLVTLTKVINDQYEVAYKPPIGIVDTCVAGSLGVHYADAWLVEHCCDSGPKTTHLASYADSPVANIGRLVTLFYERYSYTGVVDRVNPTTNALILKNALELDYWNCRGLNKVLGTIEFDMFEGLEWHDGAELSEHLNATTKVEQESKLLYMSNEQREALSDFQSFFPTCRVHGSTVYGLSSPELEG